MTLPVSMEDTELFPKLAVLKIRAPPAPFDLSVVSQMKSSLSRLWWSRLVISVRGYVINYVQSDEPTLFHCDDAFIAIHRRLAEENVDPAEVEQFTSDMATFAQYPEINAILAAKSVGHDMSDPWKDPNSKDSFTRIFGQPNITTYRVAESQKVAFMEFMRTLITLQERWKAEKEKKKGIRFETDPEWQPDDRVVLFQQFFEGNRTWVLLDFDRYVLSQWRPQGARIIFGDRFVEKKLRAGLRLCSFCGMLEQHPQQFPTGRGGVVVCSPDCLSALPKGSTTIQVS